MFSAVAELDPQLETSHEACELQDIEPVVMRAEAENENGSRR